MDLEFTWILRNGKNCRQFRKLISLSFIGQFVYPKGRGVDGLKEGKVGNKYFSQLPNQIYFDRKVHDNMV